MKLLIVLLGLLSCTFALECNGPACETIKDTTESIQGALRGIVYELNHAVAEYNKVAGAQFGDLVVEVGKSSQIKVSWTGKLTKERAAELLGMITRQVDVLKRIGALTEEVAAQAIAQAKEKLDKAVAEGVSDGVLYGDIIVKVGDGSQITIHWTGTLDEHRADGLLATISKQIGMLKGMGLITAEEAEKALASAKEELQKLIGHASDVYGATGDIGKVGEQIKKALGRAIQIIRKCAKDILDAIEARWKAISIKLGFIMKIMGQEEKWNMIKTKVDEVLAKLRTVIEHKIAAQTEYLLNTVADNVLTSFEVVEADQIEEDGKYFLDSVWEKFKALVKHFAEKLHAAKVDVLDHYKEEFKKVFKKIIAFAENQLVPLIRKLIQDVKKIIKGTATVVLAIDDEEGKQDVVLAFQDIWDRIMNALKATGKVGAVIAKIFDHYKDQLIHMIHKVAEAGLGGLEKIITDIRDDIIRIIKGGHIGYEGNGFHEIWEKILSKIRGLGKVGDIIAKIADHYRAQISGIIKKIADSGLAGIVKIINDIKDDIIRIIKSGHILPNDVDYDFDAIWEKILNSIRKLGKFGDIFAKILNHYKDQLVHMIKKVAEQGLGGLEKIIQDIKDDLIKIIKGEHITIYEHLEMSNGFADLWERMITALKNSGKFGEIFAKIINHYKDQVIDIVKKIAAKGLSGLEKIVIEIKDDIIKIIQGGHIGTAYVEDEDYSMKSIWEKVKEAAKSIGGKVGQVTRAILEKYKDQIQTSLEKIKKVAIDGSMKIIIDIKHDIVRIIEGGHVVATSSPISL